MQRYVVRYAATLPAVPTRAETMRCLRAIEPDRDRRHVAWCVIAAMVARSLRRRRLLLR
jgi:hypothetical protein